MVQTDKPRHRRHAQTLALLIAALTLGGCSTLAPIDESGGTTEGLPATCDDLAEFELDADAWPLVEADSIVIDELCGDLDTVEENDDMLIRLFAPPPEGWPAHSLPLFIFVLPAGGNELETFDHIFEPLADAGFVVLGVQRNQTSTSEMIPRHGADAVSCGLRWLTHDHVDAWERSSEVSLGCRMAAGGYQDGARGAIRATRELDLVAENLAALVLVDASSPESVHDVAPDQETSIFALAGTRTSGGVAPLFDNLNTHNDAVVWWVYGAESEAFGGGVTGSPTTKGEEISSTSIPRFVRWVMLEDEMSENGDLFYRRDYPEAFSNPSFWTGLAAWDGDHFSAEVDCELSEPPCDTTPGCAEWNNDCVQQPAIRSLVSSGDALRLISFLDVDEMPAGVEDDGVISTPFEHSDMVFADTGFPSPHSTYMMNVAWGDPLEGTVTLTSDYPGGMDISSFTHLSIKTGNRSRVEEGLMDVCESDTLGHLGYSVEVVDQAVEMLGESGPIEATGPLVVQDYPAAAPCSGIQVMETVLIPLAQFCEVEDLPQLGGYVSEVVLHFDDPGADAQVGVDDIALLTLDGPTFEEACGAQEAGWVCEVTSTLVASETSCDSEPISGVCAGLDVVNTPVDRPVVEEGPGYSSFTGWLVHTPAGWVADPGDPTMSDLENITSLCVRACEQEYEADPHLSANCSASGAFETPTLASIGLPGTRPGIPPSVRDGSGIELGQSLECSLHDDCCAGFDENVCPAVPRRPTTAGSQLRRGEEYVVEIVGTVKLYSVDDDIYEEAAVAGTIGYSRCSGGNANGPCPFYLGSAHVEMTETLAIELDCDGTPVEYSLNELNVDLGAPAMGIDFEDSSYKGFPPGALQLNTHAEAGVVEFDFSGVNQDPVVLSALDGWLQIQQNGGLRTELQVDCGPEIKPLEAWFDLDAETATEQPPLVEIDMLGTVTCNTPVDLAADAGDPDGDLASVRWEVDGVLLESSATTLLVTQPHQIKAIARDDRGATTTDTHMITCS